VYNVVNGSISKRSFVPCLIECMNSYNIQSHTFYEFNGLKGDVSCPASEFIYMLF
jgi:hypothetical protein